MAFGTDVSAPLIGVAAMALGAGMGVIAYKKGMKSMIIGSPLLLAVGAYLISQG